MQDGKHVHTSVEEYDAGSDRWSVLAGHLPFERKYHTACELGGKHLSRSYCYFRHAFEACLCGDLLH